MRRTASAADLRESIGVNLHLEYDDTPYADAGRTRRALSRIGVIHVRDAAMRSGPDREPRFVALARDGGRFDLFVNGDLTAQLASVSRLEAAAPRSVVLIEGPNEANHEAFGDVAGGNAPAAQDYQERLFEAVRGASDPPRVPVANLTYWPPLAGRADWVNFHAYPDLKRRTSPQLAWMRTMAAAVQPIGSPVVCTEAGYATAGDGSASESRQAALTLVLLLENFRAHVVRTYLYELFDEHADADVAKPDRENHFGLFRFDGGEKPVASSLARLTQLLAEPSARSRPPAAERIGVSGEALRTLEVTRNDGARLTFAWWADAQGVTRRALRVRTPPKQDVRVVDLATGGERSLGRGDTVLTSGASPLVFVQTFAAPPRERSVPS